MTANAIAIRANFVKANKQPDATRSTLTELTKQTRGTEVGPTFCLGHFAVQVGRSWRADFLDPECWAHKQSSSKMASDTWSALDCEHLITSRRMWLFMRRKNVIHHATRAQGLMLKAEQFRRLPAPNLTHDSSEYSTTRQLYQHMWSTTFESDEKCSMRRALA